MLPEPPTTVWVKRVILEYIFAAFGNTLLCLGLYIFTL